MFFANVCAKTRGNMSQGSPVSTDTLSTSIDAATVWEQCLQKIQGKVTSLSYKTWFQPILPLKLSGKEITVQVPSQFFYD
jgi:hypothetical protein